MGTAAMLPTLHSLACLFFVHKVISNGTVRQRELPCSYVLANGRYTKKMGEKVIRNGK
jgi:hypothetical protein